MQLIKRTHFKTKVICKLSTSIVEKSKEHRLEHLLDAPKFFRTLFKQCTQLCTLGAHKLQIFSKQNIFEALQFLHYQVLTLLRVANLFQVKHFATMSNRVWTESRARTKNSNMRCDTSTKVLNIEKFEFDSKQKEMIEIMVKTACVCKDN